MQLDPQVPLCMQLLRLYTTTDPTPPATFELGPQTPGAMR